MSLKDTRSGKVWVSQRFREAYQAEYAKTGIDLRQPFKNEDELFRTILRHNLESLPPESIKLLVACLELLESEK